MVVVRPEQRLLQIVGAKSVFRPQDVAEEGISRTALSRLTQQGKIEKIGRGLYRIASTGGATEHQSLLEACQRVPNSVICLLSALRFHNLTTQNPFEIWLAIDRKSWLPKVGSPPIRVVRFSGRALTEGVESHLLHGVAVRVYCPAKTVADCFKYRNKIGLDVAIEALRDCVQKKRCSFDDLWKFAKTCRVANVMRAYLESLG